MNTQQRVSVCAVVLSYNAREELVRALQSLKISSTRVDVVVVDNHSSIDPTAVLHKDFPEITVLRLSENGGFARGMNVGMRYALENAYDFVWLINQDAEIEKETLTQLLEVAMEDNRYGLLSPGIMNQNGAPWFFGGKISYRKMKTLHLTKLRTERFFESEYLTGCALLLSRQLVEQIGFLNEQYFLYYEDAEYSMKAKRAGFLPIVVPGARVKHSETSERNNEKIYWLVRSGLRFFQTMSPWYWKAWIIFFTKLRRLKNTLEQHVRPSEIASLVGRAYTDASIDNQ